MNVAIIGAGLIGGKRASALQNFPECRLALVVDVNPYAAEELAAKHRVEAETRWETAVSRTDIDIVVAATTNKFLAPVTTTALNNGKHVLCEKPLGRNILESQEILSAARRSGAFLKVGFNHRHHPGIYRAKHLVEEDEIGRIFILRCHYGHGGRPGYEKEWRADKDLCGGGELLDQGVHVVDLFRWFGGEFEQVYGKASTFYWTMDVEDNAFALFQKKGMVAAMHTSWTQWKNLFRFEVFGEKGYLIVDGLGGSYGIETLTVGKRQTKEGSSEFVEGKPVEKTRKFSGPDESWTEEWKEFLSAIREKREPLGSGYDGLMANKMLEATYRSARENKPVFI